MAVATSPGLGALAARVHADLDVGALVAERLELFGHVRPPHVGHLVTAVNVRHELGLDRVLLVVNDQPWQKLGTGDHPAEDRFAMVEAAVGSVEGIEASRIEIDRGGLSFTADTLHDLQAEAPARDLFVVLGSGRRRRAPLWERADGAGARHDRRGRPPGGPRDRPPPSWSWRVEVPRLEVSSTDLRARVADGRPLDYLLTPDVIAVVHGAACTGPRWSRSRLSDEADREPVPSRAPPGRRAGGRAPRPGAGRRADPSGSAGGGDGAAPGGRATGPGPRAPTGPRIRRRRTVLLAGMGALTIAGVALAVGGLSAVRNSTVGRYQQALGPSEPGYQASVVPTPRWAC